MYSFSFRLIEAFAREQYLFRLIEVPLYFFVIFDFIFVVLSIKPMSGAANVGRYYVGDQCTELGYTIHCCKLLVTVRIAKIYKRKEEKI